MRISRFPYYPWLVFMGAGWWTLQPAAGQQVLPKRVTAASKPRVARHPTLFPDTLRTSPLAVTYWSRRQVDSIQAALGTTRWERQQMTVDSTARYRVFRGENEYLALRLFYCPLATPDKWIEFDLNPWLVYSSLAYMHAYVVSLDQRAPEEILVKMGGGSYGSGYRTTVAQTLLLSLDGLPRLLWQSIDGREEEVVPSMTDKAGKMSGGWAARSRTVAMRRSLVYVSSVQREGAFRHPVPPLTPITPGYYQYQNGRFRRVMPPKNASNLTRPRPPH